MAASDGHAELRAGIVPYQELRESVLVWHAECLQQCQDWHSFESLTSEPDLGNQIWEYQEREGLLTRCGSGVRVSEAGCRHRIGGGYAAANGWIGWTA